MRINNCLEKSLINQKVLNADQQSSIKTQNNIKNCLLTIVLLL